ncbi:MAG: hypothetical protein EAZ85_07905 [Bacteroidetes bacterium]|nr:MAG: hypothetical protein EAZ85_07905 [Bacteroidota bacterium]TAG91356.1 MAG: hypothetical protein EAZ20_03360 [Bacteroidota bacterium]
MKSSTPLPKLNELQISLLRLFNRDMSETEILSLKRVLVQHYSTLLQEEIDEITQIKGYTQSDFDKLLEQKR